MDTMTIVYIVIALIVGVVLACIFKKGGNSSADKAAITDLSNENESLKGKLADAENKVELTKSDSAKRMDELMAKYKGMLDDTKSQTEKLDKQLKNALEGKINDSIKEQLADADKLKKKIKDLEEELEEAEDDLSIANKRLKNQDADLSELQTNFAKEQRNANELLNELSSVKAILDEKVEEFKLKMGSLDFVQEILSAPETSRSDIKQIENNIAEMKSFALSQMMDCYASLSDSYIDFGEGNFENYKFHWQNRFNEWASVTKKSWINGKTTIAFVGEFSAGKTSIVNRILSQDDLSVPRLPVSTKATTAIATYIAGAPVESYQFVTPDDKLKSISQQTFTEKASKEILDQVKGVSSLIQYFVMTYKNPNLNGLSILDTPGFNSNDKNDAERTMEVINECDALFWVFDVNAGTVNRSSISIIKEHLNKPLYIVINKVDTKASSEVQKVENLIKKTLSDEGLKVEQFIRFSAKSSLSDIMTPIKNVNHLTEKEQYVADLGANIDQNLGRLNKQVKDADNAYRQAEAKGQNIDEEFDKQMKTLYDHCTTAADIPHYEEHLFKKDNYEMSQEEYQGLRNVLDQSINDVESMDKVYNEMKDSACAIQDTWTTLCNVKAAWQSVNDLKRKYVKIKKKMQL